MLGIVYLDQLTGARHTHTYLITTKSLNSKQLKPLYYTFQWQNMVAKMNHNNGMSHEGISDHPGKPNIYMLLHTVTGIYQIHNFYCHKSVLRGIQTTVHRVQSSIE